MPEWLASNRRYCGPLVIDWCRANIVDFILGVAPTSTLRKHVLSLEASMLERFAASTQMAQADKRKILRFTTFFDAAASWSRTGRIIARVEIGPQGADTRFIVTNLEGGRAKAHYVKSGCWSSL